MWSVLDLVQHTLISLDQIIIDSDVYPHLTNKKTLRISGHNVVLLYILDKTVSRASKLVKYRSTVRKIVNTSNFHYSNMISGIRLKNELA